MINSILRSFKIFWTMVITIKTGRALLPINCPTRPCSLIYSRNCPILTTKKVAFRTAVREILWIYQKQSNDVKELQKQKVHIWDEWMMEDGTIGTAYGWVIKQFHQVDKLLEQLKNNPQDRRMMVNLWQIPVLGNRRVSALLLSVHVGRSARLSGAAERRYGPGRTI